MKVLERFHQYCLRHLLGIKWEYLTPATEVLQKAKSASISMRVMKNQMKWTDHLVRMGDDKLPKRIFYGELSEGKHPQHKPRERFKDNIKDNLRRMQINAESWESLANERDECLQFLTYTRALRNMRQAESLVQNSSVQLVSRISQTFPVI